MPLNADELGIRGRIRGIEAFLVRYGEPLEHRIGVKLLGDIRAADDGSARGEDLGECRHARSLDADEMYPVAPEGFRQMERLSHGASPGGCLANGPTGT